MILSTQDLITKAREYEVDGISASFRVCNGLLRCTHYITVDGDLLYDTGIDDEEYQTTVAEFMERYGKVMWEVNFIN